MATISLCMIVKDEELTLERCLQCAKGFADEIVVVDTGSVDPVSYTHLTVHLPWKASSKRQP